LKIKTKTVSCHTADSKPVKQEVNGTVILPPLVFPGEDIKFSKLAKLAKELSKKSNKTSSIWVTFDNAQPFLKVPSLLESLKTLQIWSQGHQLF
jgi:hypothetical protein